VKKYLIHSQLRDLPIAQDQNYSKFHKIDQKILGQKKTTMILDEKLNCQVSIHVETLRE
jgi:hypothetical protein